MRVKEREVREVRERRPGSSSTAWFPLKVTCCSCLRRLSAERAAARVVALSACQHPLLLLLLESSSLLNPSSSSSLLVLRSSTCWESLATPERGIVMEVMVREVRRWVGSSCRTSRLPGPE